MKTALCFLLCLLLPAAAWASGADSVPAHEFLVLMAFGGTQNGGDEAAFIDTEGGIYYMDMEAEGVYWYGDDTLAMLQALPDKYKIGALSADELAELLRLIDGIQSVKPVAYDIAACDAGSFTQTVYRRQANGDVQEILLMEAGDSVKENMDGNAIALSGKLLDRMAFTRRLRRWSYLFPYGDTVPLSLSFERGSFFGGSRSYVIRRSGDRLLFSAHGSNGDETDVSADLRGYEGFEMYTGLLAEWQGLIEKLSLAAWNGFDQSDLQILDGDSFSLSVVYGGSAIAQRAMKSTRRAISKRPGRWRRFSAS